MGRKPVWKTWARSGCLIVLAACIGCAPASVGPDGSAGSAQAVSSGGAAARAGAGGATAAGYRPTAADIIAGACQGAMLLGVPVSQCTGVEPATACSRQKCGLDACIAMCADYAACLTAAADPCSATCPASDACNACKSAAAQCTFVGGCDSTVACAKPTTGPGSPCALVQACCEMQVGSNRQLCLNTVSMAANLSGDKSCIGLMNDTAFLTSIANNPPCKF